MDQKWYWTELIGFDNTQEDLGVGEFLRRVSYKIEGVPLLLYSIDFLNDHDGISEEKPLSRGVCSYAGHPFGDDHPVQNWTNHELKRLIDILHQNGVKVLLSIFDLYRYRTENGEEQPEGFVEKHPEIKAFVSSQ